MSNDLVEGRAFEPHIPEFKDEAALLRFTNHLRLNIIQTKTKNGSTIDQMDDDALKLVMSAADSIDRQVLTLARIQSDNENADMDRKVALMAARLNKSVVGNPYRLDGAIDSSAPIPAPDFAVLDAIETNDFEMEQGLSAETSADFMKKYEKDQ